MLSRSFMTARLFSELGLSPETLKAIARLEPTFDFHDDYPTFDVTRKLLREALGVATADLDDFLVQEALREFELSP